MRITSSEKQTIKQIVASVDPNARVYLFGSRANEIKEPLARKILILIRNWKLKLRLNRL